MKYPVILAIDSATGPCSAALLREGKPLIVRTDNEKTMQSARLVPLIDQVLADAGCSYKDISAIACTTGPGSFTGIRVALACARGIAFAAGIPSLGFNSLQVMAWGVKQYTPEAPALIALNAGKGMHYLQSYAPGTTLTPLSPAYLGSLSDAAAIMNGGVITGNVTELPARFTSCQEVLYPRADWLAMLAAHHHNDATALSPLYIRPPDAVPSTKHPML